jgi:16S rRNA (adenine1518-N6/adenine1519-N6)-dimethyltransferase
MVDVAELNANDTVLEIGPGKGALTIELLASGANVIAIEKDSNLIPILQDKFAEYLNTGQLTLLNADITEINIKDIPISYKMIANIPYNITGEIIRMFLESNNQPQSMTILVQKEVAQRIVARDGKESILSMSVKVYGEPKYVQKVPAILFKPAPKVDSAILHIANISKDFFIKCDISEDAFFNILKRGFAQKRKMLTNNLHISSNVLVGLGIEPMARAETLTREQWATLTQQVTDML